MNTYITPKGFFVLLKHLKERLRKELYNDLISIEERFYLQDLYKNIKPFNRIEVLKTSFGSYEI
jgi:hypothetical protein